MKKIILLSFVVVFGGFLFVTPALAVSLGLVPNSQTVAIGDLFNVDVVISDLGSEIVSAFDLDVTYDQGILAATDVTFGPHLGDPSFFEAFTDFDLSISGVVDFAELSLLPDDILKFMQPVTFTLATLSFDTVGLGTSPLTFVFDQFNDLKGLEAQILEVAAEAGTVNVVPEPGTLLLLGTGLAGIAAWSGILSRRREKATRL
ncbi:MAG: PEP-CTERM sorting domain-containing protein [Desulfuromonadales bacterium]|nr:PEP-CTERM sorting domain-containing protein [Desulfuromonadales bacterium]